MCIEYTIPFFGLKNLVDIAMQVLNKQFGIIKVACTHFDMCIFTFN